ncbi:hypothetical protein CTI12_AA522160 [Artemisia annua]|uniref:Uncharacterized protein n=1 Tax=Artemisia annua TaxID=35608 RepID=A0A2U1L6E6_ARTAN|nr:hypothetical protein CTI12_AA522160 [Artemisia annua]
MDDEEQEGHLEKVNYVRRMLFLDPLVGSPIPGTQQLYINRTAHPAEISNGDTTRDDMIIKGKRRVWERGFDTKDVTGTRKESLYRALSLGLTGNEDNYLNIYLLGLMQMSRNGHPPSKYNMSKAYYQKYVAGADGADVSGLQLIDPKHVLLGAAEALSVRFIVFNAKGKDWVAQEFAPPVVGTKILRTSYALCLPSLSSVAFAYALVRSRVLRVNAPAQPSNTFEEMRLDRILRQNTIPESFTITLEQEQRIKSIPAFSDLRCLYKEDWSLPT